MHIIIILIKINKYIFQPDMVKTPPRFLYHRLKNIRNIEKGKEKTRIENEERKKTKSKYHSLLKVH